MTNLLFTPAEPDLTDELKGRTPTWRLGAEPIYLAVVRDMGVPGTLEGPAPADVLAGEVVDPVPTGPIGVVEDDGATAARPAPQRRQPTRKPRATRKQAS